MLNTPVLRVRKVGNSLGIVLPRDYVRAMALKADDEVRIALEKVLGLEDVMGRLRKYNLSVTEWNDLTNEDEEL